jgi:hypothetical protein
MLAYKPKDLNYIGRSECENCHLFGFFNGCIGSFDTVHCDRDQSDVMKSKVEADKFKAEARLYGFKI